MMHTPIQGLSLRRWLWLAAAVTLLAAAALLALPETAAAATTVPPVPDSALAPLTPGSGQGGSGVNNAGAPDWIVFSVLLGPFALLITAGLLLIFRWDAYEQKHPPQHPPQH